LKLFEKYNRLNITATILTFVVGSCTFYFLLNYILIRQLDETLQSEQQEIATYVNTHNSLPEIIPTKDQYTSFTPANAGKGTSFLSVKNTYKKGEEDLREIQFSVSPGGKYYLAKVDKPLEETEALLQVIIGVTVAMIGLILLIGYLINRIVIRRLWKPFYNTIDKVKTYHLPDQDTIKFETVDIEEFSLLNQSINEMTERIQQDYGSLKNFTGQAAHEMQTPLAIIRTKLETLMQNETLLEKNAQHIIDIEKAVHRLSRLHQSLLLLTKVENRQFVLNEDLSMDRIIEEKWNEYAEMAEEMHLSVSSDLEPTSILFHHQLAEIVVSNLLNNAIRYNRPGGNIKIELKNRQLTISNTSGNPELDPGKLFKRFYRAHTPEEGNGLGLSIVKQICDLAEYAITYTYVIDWHSFTISF
jgi:two-component system sensor histidine kinase QseC